jgi:hypothetical protein
MKLNVSLELPWELSERAIATSQQLQDCDTYFVLERTQNFPHITLFAATFDASVKDDVCVVIRGICAAFRPVLCTVVAPEHHQGYLGYDLKMTEPLYSLHRELVGVLGPLADRKVCDGREYKMDLTEQQRANMERFGYPDALELYRPHFTLTRFKHPEEAEGFAHFSTVTELVRLFPAFIALYCGVFTSGEHGVCVKRLASFKFEG